MSARKSLDRAGLIRRIEHRLAHLKTNAAAVSRRAKLGTTALHDILSGKNKNPSVPVMISIAGALDCDLGFLLGTQDGPRSQMLGTASLPVIGIVEGGAFRQKRDISPDYEEGDYVQLSAPRSQSYPQAKNFAFEVRGDAMNAADPVPIVEGMHVLCVDMADAGLMVESGKIYVVRQTRDGGQTYEWTLKRAKVYRDRIELIPESTNRLHKSIIVTLDFKTDDGRQVEAIGLVYGTYTSLER